MTTKHTPGPWTVGYNGHNINTIYGADGIGVCQTYLPINRSVELIPEIEVNPRWAGELANARLIAAAPELLAACQNIRDAIETGHNRSEAMSWLNAAIAKATGAA